MYSISEFAAMTGLTQSAIRFYERHGLRLSDRQENGYRVFTPEDAFRSNSFRLLLQYGFSVDDAVRLLDAEHGAEDFVEALLDREKELRYEADVIECRLRRIRSALDALNDGDIPGFELVDIEDFYYVAASRGRDFSVSMEGVGARTELYDLLYVSHCARIIHKDDLMGDASEVDPDYINGIVASELHRVSDATRAQLKQLQLGKCVRFRRRLNRMESVKKSTFDDLFAYLEGHGYRLRGDILILPTFLNLDKTGNDIECLCVPVV
ncbi:MerR family transcriptional regulator [Slackia heliotrinireducens]|uniref:MerR family transcriptional regulator n=1 Tax=Slackia heliotrinireducens TaxID=84110 RepID=UPI0033157B13